MKEYWLTTALARAFASNSTTVKPELFKSSSAVALNAGITLHLWYMLTANNSTKHTKLAITSIPIRNLGNHFSSFPTNSFGNIIRPRSRYVLKFYTGLSFYFRYIRSFWIIECNSNPTITWIKRKPQYNLKIDNSNITIWSYTKKKNPVDIPALPVRPDRWI